MKKAKRKAIVLILLLLITFSIINILPIAYADYMGQMENQLKNSTSYSEDPTETSQKATGLLTTIATTVKVVAVGIAIIMLLALAMKYMAAAPGEKAEIKKSAVVYIVGAVVLFAVTGILTIIQKFSTIIK